MTGYLPWWISAPSLGALTVGYWIALRRPLGVSGVLARFSRVREELAFDRGSAVVQSDLAALEAAMAAATAEAFADLPASSASPAPADAAADGRLGADMPPTPAGGPDERAQPTEPGGAVRKCAPTPSLGAHATFLVCLALGGLVAAALRGEVGAGLGDAFARHVAEGPKALAALAAGGVLIGFGSALCGGCSAGHGLTGCARLMPGSLLATAVFFAAAVGVSLLLSAGAA
jgi:hypothetical protein